MSKTTKHCPQCNETQELNKFAKNISQSDGYNTYCKICQKAYFAEYYKKNKERHIAVAKEINSKKTRYLYELCSQIKRESGCVVCNESEPCCLDFHHLDPNNKKENVSQMIRRKPNVIKFMEEIKKCIVMCSNCHRKLHAGLITLKSQ